MFEIQKNVPIPKIIARGTKDFPFSEMEVGDSILIPSQRRSSAKKYANKETASNPEKEFIFRSYEDEVRIWRTK